MGRRNLGKVATWCPQPHAGHMVDCHCATEDCSPQSSYPRFSLGAGVTPAVHPLAPVFPSWLLGTSLGNSSSTCPVGSGDLRIREELTWPGSTSRTRVRNIWRPHHIPQASNNVVVAAVTLLYSASIRPQDSGFQTRCPLLRCACLLPLTARNRKSRRRCPVLVHRPGGKKDRTSCASNSSFSTCAHTQNEANSRDLPLLIRSGRRWMHDYASAVEMFTAGSLQMPGVPIPQPNAYNMSTRGCSHKAHKSQQCACDPSCHHSCSLCCTGRFCNDGFRSVETSADE